MNYRVIAAMAATCLAAATACASIDRPAVGQWEGTAYRDGGWFSYQMASPYAVGGSYPNGALKFDKVGEFVLSPLYAAPIRKVILKCKCSSATPTRILKVAPFVSGVETNSPTAMSASDDIQVLDFPAAAGVTAFRIFLDGSSSTGVWGVSDICVFYGEKTDDEDACLREFASQLPTPENLRAADFTESTLTLAADAVAGAAGYRFEVFRLDGTPETVVREDFADAPELSGGWEFGTTNNAVLAMATSSYIDTKTAADAGALKIEKGSGAGGVRVEILSPEFPDDVTEVSFVSKRSSGDSTDKIAVYGRSSSEGAWIAIDDPFDVATSQKWTTNHVTMAGIRQVMFAFSADDAASCRPCGLDTLRVVYGGNETRTAATDAEAVHAEPSLALSGLACTRYAFRTQAVGGAGFRDSSWGDEQVVDLAWAGISVLPPTGVSASVEGGWLAVSWNEVAGAARYVVTAEPADDTLEPITAETESTSCEIVVPALGEYAVTVKAVSPGGKSEATSAAVPVSVALGSIGAVAAEATDVSEITATWSPVPLSEGYRVRLYLVGNGGARTLAETAYTMACTATFAGLDPAASYVVEVSPQPSDDAGLAAQSEEVDLSAEHFRKTGAAPLSTDGFEENFDALAGLTGDAELKRTSLDYWQLAKGEAEPEKLLYTATTNRSTGGVYAFSDAARTISSFALGSLAAGTFGCTFGIALANVGDPAVEKTMTLSFDTIQRSYRTNPAAYALEWKMTDGEAGILSEGGWTAVEIPACAPYVSADIERPEGEFRQNVSVELVLPARLAPGGVLILRWRHPKISSGPMMAIDNVRLSCTRIQRALRMTVK